MQAANNREWDRHSSGWVIMQERSRRFKEEADKLRKYGEERRKYLAERRDQGR